MPSTIFTGSKVKTLKDTLTLNGFSDIISSVDDPTASAVDAPIGSLLINRTSGKLYRKLDAGSSVNWEEVGSGTGGINYILNPSAEVNTTGWATYADAAGTAPVDGTGGSPTVTWTRSTTSPLRGVADFNFAKDAANRQGQGVSYDFTIDEADKAKVLTVTFDYEVLSGTYADGDLTVYLIADPAGTPVVIQPAGYTVLSATSGTTMRQRATFQTQATGTSYRLCFHVASTSASAYTLAVDNVVVGPQPVVLGVPTSDWVQVPASGYGTLSGLVALSREEFYRRVGDSIEWSGLINTTTTGATLGEIRIGLPNGLVGDENKLSSSEVRGAIHVLDNSTTASYAPTYVVGGVGGYIVGYGDIGIWNSSLNRPFAWDTTDFIRWNVTIPIQGWSSNTVMSSDTDTRVVAASYWRSATAAVSINAQIDFDSQAFDTSASVTTGASWKYTAPVSGYYKITSYMNSGTALASVINIYKNGSLFAPLGYTANFSTNTFSGSNIIKLNAGDYFDLRPTAAVTITGNASQSNANASFIEVERLSGPSTIAASESVNAAFSMAATASPLPSGTSNLSNTYITYTRLWDTHSIFSTTSGSVTIPLSGKYVVSGMLEIEANATGSRYLIVAQTGSVSRTVTIGGNTNPSGTNVTNIAGSAEFNCLAGDVLQFQATQTSGASRTLCANGAQYNHIGITRVGN